MTVTIVLAGAERDQLLALVRQLQTLVQQEPEDDPGYRRLHPSAYPGAPEASAEFARLTRAPLQDRRRADSQVVIDQLTAPADSELRRQTITLEVHQAWAWARTLTALRLVISERIGNSPAIESSEAEAVYEWLAYRLDQLMRAL